MACNITIDRREEQFALEREYARMKLLNRECVDKLLDHYSEVLKHSRPAQTWDLMRKEFPFDTTSQMPTQVFTIAGRNIENPPTNEGPRKTLAEWHDEREVAE